MRICPPSSVLHSLRAVEDPRRECRTTTASVLTTNRFEGSALLQPTASRGLPYYNQPLRGVCLTTTNRFEGSVLLQPTASRVFNRSKGKGLQPHERIHEPKKRRPKPPCD